MEGATDKGSISRRVDVQSYHRYIHSFISLLASFGENLLDTPDLVIIAIAGEDVSICAGANANVGCDASDASGMDCSMAVVDGLGDLAPGSLEVGAVSAAWKLSEAKG